MKTRYDFINKGSFVCIDNNHKCYDLCEMDTPSHLTVLRDFKSERAALAYAKKNGKEVIYE